MTDTDPLLRRLAAANPVPAGLPAPLPERERLYAQIAAVPRPNGRRSAMGRRTLVVFAVVAVIAAPVVAFASDIGSVFGFSNEGTPVRPEAQPQRNDTKMAQAMKALAFPGQMRRLGERAGFTFYVTRKADGDFCVAIDATGRDPESAGCVEPGTFPSPAKPILDFSGDEYRGRLVGLAADGVTRVEVLGVDDTVIASTSVADNLYAATDLPNGPAVTVAALDPNGKIIFRQPLN